MNKKTLVITAACVIAAAAAVYFIFVGHQTNKVKDPLAVKVVAGTRPAAEAFKGFDPKLNIEVQKQFNTDNKGFIQQGYKYKDNYYLTVNQTGAEGYTENYPGDALYWVQTKDGKTQYQRLGKGRGLIHLSTVDASPYIRTGNDTLIIFNDREGNADKGRDAKGYVYKVNADGTLSLILETKGVFGGIAQDPNDRVNNLIYQEKEYKDDRNQYPTIFKPYDLISKKWTGAKWQEIKKEFVKPKVVN